MINYQAAVAISQPFYLSNNLKYQTAISPSRLLPAMLSIGRDLNKKIMSLDVYLLVKKPIIKKASSGIFVRENGQTKEITQEEWNGRNPDRKPATFQQEETETKEVYSANITHNLGKMAMDACIYEHLWRPNVLKANELIEPLRQGLHNLKSEPERYKKFNPENGWGSYEVFVEFIEKYLNACYQYPDSEVMVSR